MSDQSTTCPRCAGRGWVWVSSFIDPGEAERDTCPRCDGKATA